MVSSNRFATSPRDIIEKSRYRSDDPGPRGRRTIDESRWANNNRHKSTFVVHRFHPVQVTVGLANGTVVIEPPKKTIRAVPTIADTRRANCSAPGYTMMCHRRNEMFCTSLCKITRRSELRPGIARVLSLGAKTRHDGRPCPSTACKTVALFSTEPVMTSTPDGGSKTVSGRTTTRKRWPRS